MAQTFATAGLTPQQWDSDFFLNYVRASRFKRYMGTDETSMIQLKDDLTKKKGDTVTFALVNELTGAGVTNNTTLEGTEEALGLRSHKIGVGVIRHAVSVDDWDTQKSIIDIRNAAKVQLKSWAQTKLRNDLLTAFGQVDGIAYGTASAGQRNTWTSNNQDRVLFGATTSNFNATHATALATIDNTADKLSPASLSLMKRMAQAASPKIRPITLSALDQEWFVVFVGPRSWRNLTEDNPTSNLLTLANRDARVRGEDNPLFTGDSLVWDGLIIRELPEITAITTSTVNIEPVYLCGAQAIGMAWAQRTKSTLQNTDYDFLHGVGVQEIRGIEKLRFGTGATDLLVPKDNGIMTGFFAALAD